MFMKRAEWERTAANYETMGMTRVAARIRDKLAETKGASIDVDLLEKGVRAAGMTDPPPSVRKHRGVRGPRDTRSIP